MMCLSRRFRSWLVSLGGVVVAATFCVPAPAAWARGTARKEKGAAETGLPLIDLAEYEQMVAHHRGKALMVTFWATWCEPCRAEFPMIAELAKKYGPQGLAVVGVSLDDNSDLNAIHEFLAQAHPDFPNYRQKPGIDVNAFYHGVNPDWHGTMPQTVFYARDGHIARYLIGASPQIAFENAIRLILVKSDAQMREASSATPAE